MAQVTGVHGRIIWGYHTAATIEGYVVTRTGPEWRLSARLVSQNAYHLGQEPLVFIAPHAHGEWRWPIRALDLADGRVTARLDPPVE